ncbi:M48 family metalloprotease [Nisaea sediminum]|uniref:M48 family metalloprotease n=1 Tax=Nisaea sediminum TaxID=2775867 RepID=UPI001868F39B|nr:M48 family metalloprotease [Nisaea sediminum]
MRGAILACAILIGTAASALSAEKEIWTDENTGDRWVKVEKNGKESWELLDQELPEDRLIRVYGEMFSHVNLDPAALKKMRAADEIDALKSGNVIIPAPATERFLGKLLGACLERLEADLPRVAVTFKIAHRPKDKSGALVLEARKSGLILIDPRLFARVKDPEHILFFIAHEYAHVVMQHNEDPIKDVEQRIAKVDNGGFLSSVGSNLFSGLKNASAVLSIGMEGDRMKNAALRFQEDQADMLGADILRSCGYGAKDVTGALDTVSAWETKGISFMAVRRSMENADQRIAASQTADEQNAETSKEGGASFASFFSGLGGSDSKQESGQESYGFGGAMKDSVLSIKEETEHTHRSGQARGQFMANYFAVHYKRGAAKFGVKQGKGPKADAELYRNFMASVEAKTLLKTYAKK